MSSMCYGQDNFRCQGTRRGPDAVSQRWVEWMAKPAESVLSQLPRALAHHDDRDTDHNFLPDFAWASVGGAAMLVACILLFSLTISWGVTLLGAPVPGGGAPPISTHYRELAGAFLAGFLVVLVARSLSARTS
jgi:hypothetical protein